MRIAETVGFDRTGAEGGEGVCGKATAIGACATGIAGAGCDGPLPSELAANGGTIVDEEGEGTGGPLPDGGCGWYAG